MIYSPTVWDHLLAIPISIILGLTLAALVQVLFSPRIFRRPKNRLIAAVLLFVYFSVTIAGAQEAVSGRWMADGWLLFRSFLHVIPSAILLMALRRLELANTDRPMKSNPLAAY
jgi:hypothetical protein